MDRADLLEDYERQREQSPVAAEYLRARGLVTQTIIAARLGYTGPGTRRYQNCIAIPYFNLGGLELIRYRYLDPAANGRAHKYDQHDGETPHLYGIEFTARPNVYIAEGEFDALILRQLGYDAVAIPGANLWRREFRWLFRECDGVTIITDNDEAGKKAANRMEAAIGRVCRRVRNVEMPAGVDVTDLYLADEADLKRRLAW